MSESSQFHKISMNESENSTQKRTEFPERAKRSKRIRNSKPQQTLRQYINPFIGKRSLLRNKLKNVVPANLMRQLRSFQTLDLPNIASLDINTDMTANEAFGKQITYTQNAMKLFHQTLKELPESIRRPIETKMEESSHNFFAKSISIAGYLQPIEQNQEPCQMGLSSEKVPELKLKKNEFQFKQIVEHL